MLIEDKSVKNADEFDDVVESLVLISMLAEQLAKKIIKLKSKNRTGGNHEKNR